MMRWFEKERIEFIARTIRVVGYINRSDLEKRFQISTAQASKDFQTYMRVHKKWMEPKMVYNKTMKRYEKFTQSKGGN